MFNFVRQGSLDGPLFLIGTRNTDPLIFPGGGTDFMDLYRVEIDDMEILVSACLPTSKASTCPPTRLVEAAILLISPAQRAFT